MMEYIFPTTPVTSLGVNIDTIVYISLHSFVSPLFVWFLCYFSEVSYKFAVFVDILWIIRGYNIYSRRLNSDARKRRVLITGGSRGLGLEIVKQLDKDKQKFELIVVVDKINLKTEEYDNVKFFSYDLNNTEDVSRISQLIAEYKIDVLICNAGIRQVRSLKDTDLHKIDEILNINLISNCKLINNYVKIRKTGTIVIISSLLGFVGPKNLGIYSSTKSGMLSIADSIRQESKFNIITVLPGQLDSEMFSDVFVNHFFAPVIKIQKLGHQVYRHIAYCENDDFMYPFYGKFLPIYRILPQFLKQWCRWFSGMDNV